MERIRAYLKDSYAELRKAVWPSRKQTLQHTAAVIGVSLGVAAFLGLVDYAVTKGLEVIIVR